jgi:hypothetical protein
METIPDGPVNKLVSVVHNGGFLPNEEKPSREMKT